MFSGSGKGKTTAALGLALRAVGHGMRVLVVQFLKGRKDTGELAAAQRLAPELEIRVMGGGWVPTDAAQWSDEDRERVREAWDAAQWAIAGGKYDIVVLDEINYVVHYGAIPVGDVLRLLKSKPREVHVVLTGDHAPPEVVAAADLVTEMRCIKHPFDRGVKAQKGMEF